MFILTLGTLGLHFAIAKTLATVAIGLLGGFGTLALMKLGITTAAFRHPLREGAGNGGLLAVVAYGIPSPLCVEILA